DPVEHLPRVGEHIARRLSHDRIVQDVRISATQFPCMEARRPVDIGYELLQRIVVEHAHASERRLGNILRLPLDRRTAASRLVYREQYSLLPTIRVLFAELLLLAPILFDER